MIDCRNSKELRAFIAAGPKSEADISMIDMPGYSADSLAAVTRLKTFDGLGVRIIIVLTLTETPDSVLGATAWVENFMDQAEFVVLANAKDTPFGQTFTLDGISGAKRVLALAEGRTVHIPRWSDYMRGHYDRAKGMPSDYIVGGRVYKELKLNPLSAAPWKMQHRRVTASVANVAESLTGKPARKPAPEIEEGRITVLTPKPAGTAE
jgi:hypothetical protein